MIIEAMQQAIAALKNTWVPDVQEVKAIDALREAIRHMEDQPKESGCAEGWKKLLAHLGKTQADDEAISILTILESSGLDDALDVAERFAKALGLDYEPDEICTAKDAFYCGFVYCQLKGECKYL